ncbi:MAG: hypothetical protein ACK5PW_08325 [Burkholderiales bacterium]|jgi:hypothetical protein
MRRGLFAAAVQAVAAAVLAAALPIGAAAQPSPERLEAAATAE